MYLSKLACSFQTNMQTYANSMKFKVVPNREHWKHVTGRNIHHLFRSLWFCWHNYNHWIMYDYCWDISVTTICCICGTFPPHLQPPYPQRLCCTYAAASLLNCQPRGAGGAGGAGGPWQESDIRARWIPRWQNAICGRPNLNTLMFMSLVRLRRTKTVSEHKNLPSCETKHHKTV